MIEFKENWFALLICIISVKKTSIDKSLMQMGLQESVVRGKQQHPRKSKYSKEDVNLLLKLKQEGKSNKEIGQIVGLNRNQVYGVIKMYRKR